VCRVRFFALRCVEPACARVFVHVRVADALRTGPISSSSLYYCPGHAICICRDRCMAGHHPGRSG
jgi:hypothetical protein